MTNYGTLELIDGCMASGKTALLFDCEDNLSDDSELLYVKPEQDTRSPEDSVSSRNGQYRAAVKFTELARYLEEDPSITHVFFTDAHFYSETKELQHAFMGVILNLLSNGYHLVVEGLDLSWQGNSFQAIDFVRSLAGKHTRLTATCPCGSPATHTSKQQHTESEFTCGGDEAYKAMCKRCWQVSTQGKGIK